MESGLYSTRLVRTRLVRDVKHLLEKILLKLDDLTAIKVEMKAMSTAMTHMSDEITDIKEENNRMKSKIKELEAKIELQDELKNKQMKMEERLEELKVNVHEKEQYDRNRNLEINEMDMMTNENSTDLVCKLANKFGIEHFRPDMIDKVHRIPNNNKNKCSTLIVQFKFREARDAWLKAKKHVVTNDDLFGNGNGKRVYINENMSPFYKNLFWKTKTHAAENKIKYVWFARGKVLMRKTEKDTVTWVRSEKDLK